MKQYIRNLQTAILTLSARVRIAGITNNYFGRRQDVHGRKYSAAYRKFGHKDMLSEARGANTWLIPR